MSILSWTEFSEQLIDDIESIFSMFDLLIQDDEVLRELDLEIRVHEDYNHAMYELLSTDSIINNTHEHFKYKVNQVCETLFNHKILDREDWTIDNTMYDTLKDALIRLEY